MNIEELISAIRKRPGMFVQDKRLDYIKYFITGFYCHGFVSKTVAVVDTHFSEEFHRWVKGWIKNNLGINFEEEHGWYEYIAASTKSNEEAFELFFRLTDEFFREFHQFDKN
ncbi:hypothetical protein [Saccharibacillus deserti]|uniref:hypothetical protein n=1 Tax=Saccharibacillus deserti TaxID=1634444 RepID=UPI0015571375|nr:hypothetical protein [Saccharibacillus deserti]